MATQELSHTENIDEFQQIMNHIKSGNDFILSGGAGSGKTYTLVQVIRQALKDYPSFNIACITYTNAAVKEIEERVNHKNLHVSTIHDFLWDNIKYYQQELVNGLIYLLNDANITKIKIDGMNTVPENIFTSLENGIQYKEYLKLKDGIISHDELLILSDYMFNKYKKLCDILKDRFKYIFVDEYQDTQKEVINILLEHLNQSQKKNIIGFFGDAMQSIYDDGVGNLKKYIDSSRLKEVKKEQNRRNPRIVIELANKLRTDGLIQKPSEDKRAPNMTVDGNVKEGKVNFIYSKSADIIKVREYLGWNFDDTAENKELNLTYNLIAGKAGFRNLMDIYDKDQILEYRDRLKRYIKDNNINNDFSNNTFGEVIEYLTRGKTGRKLNAVLPTAGMKRFIDENTQLYEETKQYNYLELAKIYINKDHLIDDKKQNTDDENKKGSKRDDLIKHLFKIQSNISLYENKLFNEFLQVTDYKIKCIQDKKTLKEAIESLVIVGDKTVGDVITEADEKGICRIDDRLLRFQKEKRYIYNRIKTIRYDEFQKLYFYLEGHTPFSTQHKTKGTEFNNVLVILDNGRWNNYNFENLFLGTGTASVLERTQKIFYVCCTRTKENLAVLFNDPSSAVIEKAKEWFGVGNVIDLDALQ